MGADLKTGDIVRESTVYPGSTEEDCLPVLEQSSGLVGGRDFTVAFSPKRINPGDKRHRFETIRKVVSGQDAHTLDIVAETHGAVVEAGVFRAASIKVAEAARAETGAEGEGSPPGDHGLGRYGGDDTRAPAPATERRRPARLLDLGIVPSAT